MVAVLYASTLSAGTYILEMFVLLNELEYSDGGVAANIVILVRAEQFLKAPSLIFITLLGIVTSVRLVQYSKAD